MQKKFKSANGISFPVGPSKTKDGVNFCVYSHHAKKVELQFFKDKNDEKPFQVFELLAPENKKEWQ